MRLIFGIGSCFKTRIQFRKDSIKTERPTCPNQCSGRLHRHGHYQRFRSASGQERRKIQRYLCPLCGHTVSVLPAEALPYRPLEVNRLEAHLDEKAEVGSGPDPPPDEAEAGGLRRAWSRFQRRVEPLRQALGQMLPASLSSPKQMWLELRRALGSLQAILHWLAQKRNLSLLGDYRCLRPAASA